MSQLLYLPFMIGVITYLRRVVRLNLSLVGQLLIHTKEGKRQLFKKVHLYQKEACSRN